MTSATYELLQGDAHRHGTLRHAHPHSGSHEHPSLRSHDHEHTREDHGGYAHGHSHGLVHDSIKRSRDGVRIVTIALAILASTAVVQALVFVLTGSLALLADLIHNGGDALTAIPLAIAFALRSDRAERLAGMAVVAAIFISACVAAYATILRLIHPSTPGHLLALALAGAVGFAGPDPRPIDRLGHDPRDPAHHPRELGHSTRARLRARGCRPLDDEFGRVQESKGSC